MLGVVVAMTDGGTGQPEPLALVGEALHALLPGRGSQTTASTAST